MKKYKTRLVIYSVLVGFLAFIYPLKGEYRTSNAVNEYLYLNGDKMAVTFPWKGVLIKSGLKGYKLESTLRHEKCHVDQIESLGVTTYIIVLSNRAEILEGVCNNLEAYYVNKVILKL